MNTLPSNATISSVQEILDILLEAMAGLSWYMT